MEGFLCRTEFWEVRSDIARCVIQMSPVEDRRPSPWGCLLVSVNGCRQQVVQCERQKRLLLRANMKVGQPVLIALFITSGVWCQDQEYLARLEYFYECPKECKCPGRFSNALYCDSKNIREMPLVPSRVLYAYLQNNLIDAISDKSFKNETQLKWLNLNKNMITSTNIGKDLFKKMENLLYLYLEDNNLEEVPSPLPSSLEQLRLARNRISSIPEGTFSNLEKLTMLDLQGNRLKDSVIQPNTFRGLKMLLQLNLAQNDLKAMPEQVPASTLQLYLDNNSIKEIPIDYFSSLSKLSFVRLNNNEISNIGVPETVFNVSSIIDLQLSYNQLTAVPLIHFSLQHLHLDHNQIKKINGAQICPVPVNTIYQRPIGEHQPQLRYLRLDGNGIKPPIPLELMMCFRLLSAIVI
ncbi:keratocan [Narcine bancroftii]|uniref:keratocan n=1 Tax=Narcine bancroftii TaxID=1343680 RepID=UPI0038321CED